jgi:hypothetical protein
MRIVLITLVALAGCGEAVMPCDTSMVTFSELKSNVFGAGPVNPKSCTFSSCHDHEANPQGMLDLQTDPYTALVGATPTDAAAAAKGWKRVVAGDTANSYLHYKLNLSAACDPGCPDQMLCTAGPACLGLRMPNTGQQLDDCTLKKIDAWITAGAKND